MLLLSNQQSNHAQTLSSAYHSIQALIGQQNQKFSNGNITHYSYDAHVLAQNHQALSSAITVAAGDSYSSSGNLNISLVNDGTVAAGTPPVVLTVAAYSQASNATLDIQLGGNSPGSIDGTYSQLNAIGNASLNGTLAISLVNGFKPADGQVFTILTYGTVQGQFSNISGLLDTADGLYFKVTQGAHALTLTAAPLTAAVSAAFAQLPVSLDSSNNLLIGGLNQGSVINVGASGTSATLVINNNLTIDNPQLGGETFINQALTLTGTSSLQINGSGHTTQISADMSVGGTETLSDSISVAKSNLTIAAGTSGSGDLTLGGSTGQYIFGYNASNSLNLLSPGNVVIDATIGTISSESGSTLLGNLTIGSALHPVSSVTFDGNVNLTGNLSIYSSGAVTFGGSTTLGGNLTLNTGGATTFVGSTTLGGNLTLNTSGSVTFDQSLTLGGPLAITVSGNATQRTVHFDASVTLTSAANFTILGAKSLVFDANTSIGSGNVLLQSDQMSFSPGGSGSFAGSGTLTLEPSNAAENIALGDPSASVSSPMLTLHNSDIEAWAGTFASITIGYATAGHASSGLGNVYIGGTNNFGMSTLPTFNDSVTIYGNNITVESFSQPSFTFYVNGNLNLDAYNSITIQNLVTAQTGSGNANIVLYAAKGSITEANSSSVLIGADLNAQAMTGISLPNIEMATLTAINYGISGDISIGQMAAGGNLGVTDVAQSNASGSGAIMLSTAAGTMTVLSSGLGISDVGSGSISLTVAGANQSLQVNDHIGSHGAINLTALGGDIVTTAGISSSSGAISVTSSGALTNNATVSSTGGAISLSAQGSDVNVNASISSAGGTQTLTAAGNIVMANGTVISALDSGNNGILNLSAGKAITLNQLAAGGSINVTATAGAITLANSAIINIDGGATGSAQLNLIAGSGIATVASPLATQIAQLSISNTGSGNVFVTNSVGMTLKGSGSSAVSLSGNTGVTELVTKTGSLQVKGTVSSTATGGTAGQTGNILLASLGGSTPDITLSGALSTVSGSISIESAGSIVEHSGISSVGGSVDLTAGSGSIAMDSGSLIQSTSGAIRLDASNSVVLGKLSTAANVSLIATGGGISSANTSALNVSANGLRMDAGSSIGTGSYALLTDVNTITAATTNGGMYLHNDQNLTIGKVAVSINQSTIGSLTTSMVTDASQADVLSGGNGNIVVQVQSGNLSLNDGSSSSSQVVSANGSGNILLQTLGSGDISESVNDNISSGTGNISVLSAAHINQSGNISSGGAGTLDILAAGGNISMASGALDQSGSGAIRLDASNGIAIAAVTSSGNVSLIAGSGSISNHNGTALNVSAASLRLNAGSGIGSGTAALSTHVSNVSAMAGSGGLYLHDNESVSVGDVGASVNRVGSTGGTSIGASTDQNQSDLSTSNGGNIVLQVQGGSITLNDGSATDSAQAVTASGSGNILLQTLGSGDIHVSANGNLSSGTGNINLLAAGNVTQAASISTGGSGTLDIEAGVNLSMASGTSDQSGSGTIRLDASGDMAVAGVSTSGDVSLIAGSGDISSSNGSSVNVTANNLRLNAGKNIGSNNGSSISSSTNAALNTTVTTLGAVTGSGSMYLENSQGVTVGSVAISYNSVNVDGSVSSESDGTESALVTGSGSNGSIVLQAQAGNISLNGAGANGVAVSADGSGNVLVQTLGSGDIIANASLTSGSGNISLLSSGSVMQAANIRTGSSGTLDIDAAGGNVSMASGTSANSSSGDIRIEASQGIALSQVGNSADISLIAGSGSILNASGNSALNISAASLRLDAGTGIGSGTAALSTHVSNVSAMAGSGGLYLHDNESVSVGDVGASVNRVGSSGSSTVKVDAPQPDLSTSNGGNIVLQVQGGDISLNDGSTSSLNQAVRANGSGNILLQTLGSGDIILSANDNVSSGSGSISLLSAANVLQSANLSSSGTLDIEAVGGKLGMTAGTLDQSGSANIRLYAGSEMAVAGVSTTGAVSLIAASGDISNNNGSNVNVTANGLRLTAGASVGSSNAALSTSVTTLSGVASSGSIYLDNTRGVTVGGVVVGYNSVNADGSISGQSDQLQSDLSTGSGSNGNIVLQAQAGSMVLTNDGSGGVAVSANGSGNVLLQTLGSGDITLNAKVASSSGSISVAAAGNVVQNVNGNLGSSGTLDVYAGGSVTMVAGAVDQSSSAMRIEAGTDIALATLSTSGDVSLSADHGSISNNLGNNSGSNVSAAGLRLDAGNGIGSGSKAFGTTVSSVSAAAGSGGLYLSNTQSLSVDAVAVTVNRVGTNGIASPSVVDGAQSGLTTSANGNIVLQVQSGNLTLNGASNANGSGNVLLQTLGNGGNINSNASLTSANGNISMLAAANVTQASGSISSSGSGTLDILAAGGNVSMAAGTLEQSSSGAIRIQASNGIALAGVATSGSVSLLAGSGSISEANGSAVTVSAAAVRLNAGNGIGAAGAVLVIDVGTVSAVAGAGGISLLNDQSTTVGSVALNYRRVNADGSSAVLSDNAQAGLLTSANGNIALQTSAGNISLTAAPNGAVNGVAVSANGSGKVLVETLASNGDIKLNGNLVSGTGNITVLAGHDAVMYNTSSGATSQLLTSSPGLVNVLARTGSIFSGGTLSSATGGTILPTNLTANSLTLVTALIGSGQQLNIAPNSVPAGQTPDAIHVGGSATAGTLYLSLPQIGLIGSGFSTVQLGSSMPGQVIHISGQDSSGNPSPATFVDPLTLQASGAGAAVSISGTLNAVSLLIQGSNSGTTLADASVNMHGNVEINDNVIVTGGSSISAGTDGSGSLVVTGAVSGAGSAALSLSALGGDIAIQGAVSGLGQLNVSEAHNVTFSQSLAINGNVTIHASGVVTFSGAVTIGAGGALDIEGASSVVFAGSGNFSAAGNVTLAAKAIAFNGGARSISGAGVLTLSGITSSSAIALGDPGSNGALNLGQSDLSAINAGFSQVVIGGVNSSTGHASTGDGSVTLSSNADLSSIAGPVAIYGNTISVTAAGTGVTFDGALSLDAVGNITLGSNLHAAVSANVSLTSAGGAISMGAGTQIITLGGNVSIASGAAQTIRLATIDTRQSGSEAGGIVSIHNQAGQVLDANADSNVNIYGDVVSLYGIGADAGSATAARDVLKIKAPVVSVNAPSGIVLDDAGYDGRSNINLLDNGQMYNEGVIVGATTRVSGDARAIVAAGTQALIDAGVIHSMIAPALLAAVAKQNMSSSGFVSTLANWNSSVSSEAVVTVEAVPGDYALAASLQQSLVLGSAGSQPYASGLSAYSKGSFDYWTETVTL